MFYYHAYVFIFENNASLLRKLFVDNMADVQNLNLALCLFGMTDEQLKLHK